MTTVGKKGDNVDYSVEEKILALYELQKIDSQIDEIKKLKGELPLEVGDLEDEVAGLQTRIDSINSEIEHVAALTAQRKGIIEEANTLIIRYTEQQNNVRNNREFDSLTKEIEYQNLEIELAEKHLKEYSVTSRVKKSQLEEVNLIVADRHIDLAEKRIELESIEKETQDDLNILTNEETIAKARIDNRLLTAYERIRSNARNGMAVVSVKRNACGGCFNSIPPQRQADIRQGKRIIICEYCGRILVSETLGMAPEDIL